MMGRRIVAVPYVTLLRKKTLEPESFIRKTMVYGRSVTEASKKPLEIISCLWIATIISMMTMSGFFMEPSIKTGISTLWLFVAIPVYMEMTESLPLPRIQLIP